MAYAGLDCKGPLSLSLLLEGLVTCCLSLACLSRLSLSLWRDGGCRQGAKGDVHTCVPHALSLSHTTVRVL